MPLTYYPIPEPVMEGLRKALRKVKRNRQKLDPGGYQHRYQEALRELGDAYDDCVKCLLLGDRKLKGYIESWGRTIPAYDYEKDDDKFYQAFRRRMGWFLHQFYTMINALHWYNPEHQKKYGKDQKYFEVQRYHAILSVYVMQIEQFVHNPQWEAVMIHGGYTLPAVTQESTYWYSYVYREESGAWDICVNDIPDVVQDLERGIAEEAWYLTIANDGMDKAKARVVELKARWVKERGKNEYK